MKNLLTWLKKQNEYIPLLASFLIFFISPFLLRAIDKRAGTYDIGVLQINITAIISFGIFQAIVWMTLKVNWLPIRQYFELWFTTDFKSLTKCQKVLISLAVYFLLLYALVLLNQVIPAVPTMPLPVAR